MYWCVYVCLCVRVRVRVLCTPVRDGCACTAAAGPAPRAGQDAQPSAARPRLAGCWRLHSVPHTLSCYFKISRGSESLSWLKKSVLCPHRWRVHGAGRRGRGGAALCSPRPRCRRLRSWQGDVGRGACSQVAPGEKLTVRRSSEMPGAPPSSPPCRESPRRRQSPGHPITAAGAPAAGRVPCFLAETLAGRSRVHSRGAR